MGSRRYLLYTLHNAAMMCRQIDRCSVDAGTRPYTQHAPHSQYLRRAGRGVRQRRAPPSGGAGRAAGAAAGLRARGPLRGLLVDSGDWVTVERDLGVGGWRLHDRASVRWFYISRSRGGAPATVGPGRHGHDLPVSARERVRAHPVNECGCGRGAAGAGAAERREVVGKLRCAL